MTNTTSKQTYYASYLKNMQFRTYTDTYSFKIKNNIWQFSYDEEGINEVINLYPSEAKEILHTLSVSKILISFYSEGSS